MEMFHVIDIDERRGAAPPPEWLIKAHVKSHFRRGPNGKLIWIEDYDDKRHAAQVHISFHKGDKVKMEKGKNHGGKIATVQHYDPKKAVLRLITEDGHQTVSKPEKVKWLSGTGGYGPAAGKKAAKFVEPLYHGPELEFVKDVLGLFPTSWKEEPVKGWIKWHDDVKALKDADQMFIQAISEMKSPQHLYALMRVLARNGKLELADEAYKKLAGMAGIDLPGFDAPEKTTTSKQEHDPTDWYGLPGKEKAAIVELLEKNLDIHQVTKNDLEYKEMEQYFNNNIMTWLHKDVAVEFLVELHEDEYQMHYTLANVCLGAKQGKLAGIILSHLHDQAKAAQAKKTATSTENTTTSSEPEPPPPTDTGKPETMSIKNPYGIKPLDIGNIDLNQNPKEFQQGGQKGKNGEYVDLYDHKEMQAHLGIKDTPIAQLIEKKADQLKAMSDAQLKGLIDQTEAPQELYEIYKTLHNQQAGIKNFPLCWHALIKLDHKAKIANAKHIKAAATADAELHEAIVKHKESGFFEKHNKSGDTIPAHKTYNEQEARQDIKSWLTKAGHTDDIDHKVNRMYACAHRYCDSRYKEMRAAYFIEHGMAPPYLQGMEPETVKKYADEAHWLEDMLEVAPPFEPKKLLFRGMKATAHLFQHLDVGDHYPLGAPSSFSTDENAAVGFSGDTMLIVHNGAPRATSVKVMSGHNNEDEVLVSGHSALKILKKEMKGHRWYVHCIVDHIEPRKPKNL